MSDSAGAPPARVAIKFGTPAPPNGRDSKKNSRPKPGSSLGKRHRAHALNDESESDEDDDNDEDHTTGGGHEAITAYGPDGASSDDRQASRHRRRSRSPHSGRHAGRDSGSSRKSRREDVHQSGSLREVDLADKDKPIKWGLTINSKPRQRKEEESLDDRDQGDRDHQETKPKTADEEAMDALMAKPGERKIRQNNRSSDPDRDPDLDDYRSVPVEDFGATLLRGFGWDGKMRGKVKEVTKHANLTGLGAKDLKGAEDLGAWSQKSNKDNSGKPRPSRLDDYRREEEKKRQRRQDRHGDSYRHERERENTRDRERDRDRRRDRR